MARHFALILALLVAGCAGRDTVTIRVPVVQHPVPPAELLEPIDAPVGVFTAPGEGEAVACLLPPGKDLLVGYVDALRRRVAAWEAWGR